MLRSLFSGISGLRAHQQMMDVVGNNISNVNTAGYKTANVVFEDIVSQQVLNPGAPVPVVGGNQFVRPNGGVNGGQIGLGVRIAEVSNNFSQGSAQITGKNTDMMIQGDGFFVVNNGSENLYTRAGSFNLDANGSLVTPDGTIVQGWMANPQGTIDANSTPSGIKLPVGQLLPPVASTLEVVNGNIPSNAIVGTKLVSSIITYDALGNQINVPTNFEKLSDGGSGGSNTWKLSIGEDGTANETAGITLTFGPDGKLTDPLTGALLAANAGVLTLDANTGKITTTTAQTTTALAGPPVVPSVTLNVDVTGITQYGNENTLSTLSQDGFAMGSLQGISLTREGVLIGVFSNGNKQPMAQLAIANFNNPGGLEKVGNTSFRTAVNSGVAQIGTATVGGRGVIAGGTLEMSNVDLAAEFTNLIVAQRGFQANSKIMTTSDEMLNELVNLKR
jgi:flagellar hook protein FlgE